jgi:hypothetical protein
VSNHRQEHHMFDEAKGATDQKRVGQAVLVEGQRRDLRGRRHDGVAPADSRKARSQVQGDQRMLTAAASTAGSLSCSCTDTPFCGSKTATAKLGPRVVERSELYSLGVSGQIVVDQELVLLRKNQKSSAEAGSEASSRDDDRKQRTLREAVVGFVLVNCTETVGKSTLAVAISVL